MSVTQPRARPSPGAASGDVPAYREPFAGCVAGQRTLPGELRRLGALDERVMEKAPAQRLAKRVLAVAGGLLELVRGHGPGHLDVVKERGPGLLAHELVNGDGLDGDGSLNRRVVTVDRPTA